MTARQLTGYLSREDIATFLSIGAPNVAEFCLEMYTRMGMLDGIEVVRSSDPEFRRTACEISDYFVDVPYEGEIVRARMKDGQLSLFKGGGVSVELPPTPYSKEQISPTRDTRFLWMQSVVGCTHYVCGLGEKGYMNLEESPDVNFVIRDTIDRSDEAYVR